MFVQALIPEAPIKRFDIGILVRLAKLNQEVLNAMGMWFVPIKRPEQQALVVLNRARQGFVKAEKSKQPVAWLAC